MLTSRMLLRRGHTSYLKWSYASTRRFVQPAEESEEIVINLDVRLAPLSKKKPQREAFARNLFIGKYDNEITAFPEVLSNDRQNQFNEWLAPIEECVDRNFDPNKTDENILSSEGVEQLAELGVFRASLTEEQKGIGLSATEYAKLFEILGKNPSLATYVASRTDPIEMLLTYGSEEQKSQYLPRFVSGELIPTFAILETNTGKNTTPLSSTAIATQCRKYWKLNADKILVTNGNEANCFIVLSNCTETDDPFHKPDAPSLFIIETKHEGISSSDPVEKVGQRGVKSCSINFKDTIIPRENIVDKVGGASKIMINLLTLGKQNVGAQAVAILRRFIDAISEHVIETKHFDKQLMDYDFTHEVIAKMTIALYTIESMTYLTTGLMDQFEEQDCSIEKAIVEAYSARECIAQIYEGMKLIGRQSYLKDNQYERIYRDALALNLFNSSTIDLYTFIAIMGLHHAGSYHSAAVQKYRNPFMFPKFILKEVFSSQAGPDLAIEEHLHPSLQVSARLLQSAVHLLHESTGMMLVNHGAKVTEAHMELRRLAEIVMEIYAMTATLARASRSYCIGLKHSKDDIIIAHTVCFTGHHKVKLNYTEIEAGDTQNCDDIYKSISRRVFQQKGYFPEHPLKKNF